MYNPEGDLCGNVGVGFVAPPFLPGHTCVNYIAQQAFE